MALWAVHDWPEIAIGIVATIVCPITSIYLWGKRRSTATTAQAIAVTLAAVASMLLWFTRTQMFGALLMIAGVLTFGYSFWLADRELHRYEREHPLP